VSRYDNPDNRLALTGARQLITAGRETEAAMMVAVTYVVQIISSLRIAAVGVVNELRLGSSA